MGNEVKELNHSGIYAIVCEPTGKRYIGQTIKLHKRWAQHRGELRAGTHHNAPLQYSFAKYGEASFAFLTLELCETSQLNNREQFWLDATPKDKKLNICPTAESCLGRPGTPCSPEVKARLRAINLGKRQSAEICLKKSISHLGKRQSEQHIKNRAAAYRGFKHSEETKAKLSAWRSGRKLSPLSDSHKAAISAGLLRRRARAAD